MPLTVQFHQVSIGQRFEFRGRRYQKLALSLACDEDRYANIFLDQTEVLPHQLVSYPNRPIVCHPKASGPEVLCQRA